MKDKVLFIGYEWNLKRTASSVFFVDLLKQHFEVDIEFYTKENYKKILKKCTNEYFAIFFFQITPKEIRKIKCKNVFLIPMYDDFHLTRNRVWMILKYKTICFSKKLESDIKTVKYAQTFHIQYFPKPIDLSSSNKNLLFFWQRRDFTWSKLKQVLPSADKIKQELGIKKIIIHSVTDGFDEFEKPSEEDIRDYNIEITTWFKDKNEISNILKKTKYYVAPREKEGIGFSFIDAMQNECIVIAHNDSTMNEYIVHGENGYLIDFKKPTKINFLDDKKLSENLKQINRNLNTNYNNQIDYLINFIKSPPLKQNSIKKYIVYLSYILKQIKNKFFK